MTISPAITARDKQEEALMTFNWFTGLNLGLQILNDAAQLQLLHGGDRKKAIVNDAGQLIATVAALTPNDPLLREFALVVSTTGGIWAGGDISAALVALGALRVEDARWQKFVRVIGAAYKEYETPDATVPAPEPTA